MHLVTDVQSWLDLQLKMVKSINPAQQNERVNGVLSTIQMVDRAFKEDLNFDVSKLPHAPTAKENQNWWDFCQIFVTQFRLQHFLGNE